MRKCKHTSWFRVFKDREELILEVSDRGKRVISNVPLVKSSSLVVIFGGQSEALQAALGTSQQVKPRSRIEGEAHLVEAKSLIPNRSALIADCVIASGRKHRPGAAPRKCHEVNVLRRRGNDISIADLTSKAAHMYLQLFYSVADVVCLVCADIGGLEATLQYLSSLLDRGLPTTTSLRPWLILITDSRADNESETSLEELVDDDRMANIVRYFTGLRVCAIPSSRRSRVRRDRELKEEIIYGIRETQTSRENLGMSFLPRHLIALAECAAAHVAGNSKSPFDPITASRRGRPVPPELVQNVEHFMKRFVDPLDISSFAAPVLATSLLLDSYPPDMHHFRPGDVLRTLYETSLLNIAKTAVLNNSKHFMLPSAFLALVKSHFIGSFEEMVRTKSTAKDLHLRTLLKYRHKWATCRSDHTCLLCLCRSLQWYLPCGHSVCENCVQIYGTASDDDRWLFHIDHCLLCGRDTNGFTSRLRPPTAGVRILSIDGGGARGRIPLEFVQVVQEHLPYPFQENFDMAFGTSSGALIVLGLFSNGWCIEDCITCFERVAHLAFQSNSAFPIALISKAVGLLMSIFVDGRYSARKLELVLKRIFGERSMMESPQLAEYGCKIGIPVTSVDDFPCVFTSYHAVRSESPNSGYEVVNERDNARKTPIWEIARCGTAAPYFFKPHHIFGVGAFQDGGLWGNNPVKVARQESLVLSPDAKPSIVVSFGTGHAKAPTWVRPDAGPKGIFEDNFAARLFRSMMGQLSGGRIWKEFISHRKTEDTGTEYFRFDVEFDGGEPRLDDVGRMGELGPIARKTISQSQELSRLTSCLIAELFFFELERLPMRENGYFTCRGHVFCRLKTGKKGYLELLAILEQTNSTLMINNTALPGGFHSHRALDRRGNIQRYVTFQVSSRDEGVSVYLSRGSSRYNISGSPFSLGQLIRAQSLDAVFGTANHQKRRWLEGDIIACPNKRRRLF